MQICSLVAIAQQCVSVKPYVEKPLLEFKIFDFVLEEALRGILALPTLVYELLAFRLEKK